ncbi:MAG: hypothetical protein K6T65_16420, partial [Peptococcaceae bacterium]|nr:hypothetical protein [Peptococcaceae bacterium]
MGINIEKKQHSLKESWKYAVVGICSVAMVGLSLFSGQERLLAALLAALILSFSVVSRPVAAVTFLLLYLPLMGFIRRFFITFAGWSQYDPLVLLYPFVSGILAVVSLRGNPSIYNSALSRLIVILMIICLLQIANPLQGGMMVGLGGAIFLFTPLCWFFIGKRFLDEHLFVRLEKIVLVLGVICGAYGLWQTFYGFLPFEKQWIDTVRAQYVTLVVYDKTRAFSTFNNAVEYTCFMGLVLVCCIARLITGGSHKRWFFILLALLAVICFLNNGVRSLVVMLVFASLVISVIRARRPLKIMLCIAAFLVVIVATMTVLKGLELPEDTSPLIKHLIGGVTEPFNPEKSSLGGHVGSLVIGLLHGLN